MINPKDEEWLKRVLNDCLENKACGHEDKHTLRGFKMLVSNLVRSIERNLKDVKALWEKDPQSKELKRKFDSLEKALLYLRRFCDKRIKTKD